jgi:hypothetical protein
MPKKIRIFSIGVLLTLIFCFSFPLVTQGALSLRTGLHDFKTSSDIGGAPIGVVVGRVVKVLLGVLGLVCLVIFVIAGFQWMTSGGNKEKIQGAQKSMSAAIIGLIIVIVAWAAIDFIVGALESVT